MNEAETRAELIDPKLRASGWGIDGSKVQREYPITLGKIQTGGVRGKSLTADYVLVYHGRKLAVIEAKSNELPVGEGVAQAKNYAEKLQLATTFSTNGIEIYQICMKTGAEGLIDTFPSPEELWHTTFAAPDPWEKRFNRIAFEDIGGTKTVRYYQELAVHKALAAIAQEKQRILLTLATGTGKTFIAFQIVWKLFQSRWNLNRDGKRRPRILFLADRNILTDQAFNAFSPFPSDALVRIKPGEIRRNGRVPTNGSIFFTIFQTFMTGPENSPCFGEYPKEYFDLIIIDECHRGGANNESNWRSILDYFAPAVQIGLTATPKRNDNVDTYNYFGEPVFIYSLKEGINDGFLTPFRVKRIKTTIDDYIYTSDDQVIEGEVEEGRLYTEQEFNNIIEIKAREAKRVQILLSEINQKEKSIVFCANQAHAAMIRDLINQFKSSTETNYCVRVTANDGELGEQHLRAFQDNEKTVPTILTTSQKLSTGVDALNIRNIVLLRPINTIIEFKQIIGRGTRLFDGKEYFTIYDFVDACHHFSDVEWDGEPLDQTTITEGIPPTTTINDKIEPYPPPPTDSPEPSGEPRKKIRIKLSDGKERELQHMIATSFWSADGRVISAEEFLQGMFGVLPEFFKNEEELKMLWSNPKTRRTLLDKLADAGYGKQELESIQKLINAEKSDLFDVLEFISFAHRPITREARVAEAQESIYSELDDKQKEFIQFVLAQYVESGVGELDQEKLPHLLQLKYHALPDAIAILGTTDTILSTFIGFQKYLYQQSAA
ncbi:MAG: DEAD/DEAH box helicase family protein [Chlorobiaceae bacterium]